MVIDGGEYGEEGRLGAVLLSGDAGGWWGGWLVVEGGGGLGLEGDRLRGVVRGGSMRSCFGWGDVVGVRGEGRRGAGAVSFGIWERWRGLGRLAGGGGGECGMEWELRLWGGRVVVGGGEARGVVGGGEEGRRKGRAGDGGNRSRKGHGGSCAVLGLSNNTTKPKPFLLFSFVFVEELILSRLAISGDGELGHLGSDEMELTRVAILHNVLAATISLIINPC
ncbi:hypothetical protein Tco_0649513 [Tanacetum coccineum]